MVNTEILGLVLDLLIIGIPIAIIGYWLGKRQANDNWKRELAQREKEHIEEMQLLRDQLEEQKKQRDFAERVYQEENKPKQQLMNWNIKT